MSWMTEERLMIQSSARDFAMKEVLPLANRLDPVQGMIPDALIAQMAELGYFGIVVEEKYGGLGLGAFEYCLVAEELSRAWMSVGSLLARGNTMIGMEAMSEEWRADMLPRVARGELLGAFAMSEPNAGSDIANIATRAVRDGDDYVITGNKYWCTFADGADFITVIEACRQLMYHVCDQIDSGRRCDKEASMVKYLASEMSERVTSEALQILGGAGYTTHYAVERYWRDARLTKIFEGTSEIQLRIISDYLLGRESLPGTA